MTFQIYAIKDVCTRFVHLFVEDNDATATRLFKSWCYGKFKCEDYELWHIGSWDTDSGYITAKKKIDFMCDGSDIEK